MNIEAEIKRAQPVLDRVNDAIRANPLAAGFIGAGIAWMLFGAKGFGVVGSIAKGASGKVASAAAGAGNAAFNAGSAASAAVKSVASDTVGAVASIVPDLTVGETEAVRAAADLGATVNERVQAIASSGLEYGTAIQSRLSESLERQPLLLGALGLAIGAGIASTFATTEAERQWMGEEGAAARETVLGAVDEAKDRARQVVSDVQDEAARHGLTLDAAKDAAKSIRGKVGNVAGAAQDAVVQPFKSTT